MLVLGSLMLVAVVAALAVVLGMALATAVMAAASAAAVATVMAAAVEAVVSVVVFVAMAPLTASVSVVSWLSMPTVTDRFLVDPGDQANSHAQATVDTQGQVPPNKHTRCATEKK